MYPGGAVPGTQRGAGSLLLPAPRHSVLQL